jgi:hypothetical protein
MCTKDPVNIITGEFIQSIGHQLGSKCQSLHKIVHELGQFHFFSNLRSQPNGCTPTFTTRFVEKEAKFSF